jgi:hypothetical protein
MPKMEKRQDEIIVVLGTEVRLERQKVGLMPV